MVYFKQIAIFAKKCAFCKKYILDRKRLFMELSYEQAHIFHRNLLVCNMHHLKILLNMFDCCCRERCRKRKNIFSDCYLLKHLLPLTLSECSLIIYFINILRAAFAHISFQQKITNTNCK